MTPIIGHIWVRNTNTTEEGPDAGFSALYIDFDSSGNMYLAGGSEMHKYTCNHAAGSWTYTEVTTGGWPADYTGVIHFGGLRFNPVTNSLWAIDGLGDGHVYELSRTDGSVLQDWPIDAPSVDISAPTPACLAVDSAGDLWIGDTSATFPNGILKKFQTDGTYIKYIHPNPSRVVFSVEYGSDDMLYVGLDVNGISSGIYQLDPTASGSVGPSIVASDSFGAIYNPRELMYGSNGKLYDADHNHHVVFGWPADLNEYDGVWGTSPGSTFTNGEESSTSTPRDIREYAANGFIYALWNMDHTGAVKVKRKRLF